MNTRALWRSVLLGGVVMGLLGSLPFLNLINCLLCIWVWLGGAMTVSLYRRYEGGTSGPTSSQGAILGAVAGVIGALVGFVVFSLTGGFTFMILNSIGEALGGQGQVTAHPFSLAGSLGTPLLLLAIDIVLYPLFGALSGLIVANSGKRPG